MYTSPELWDGPTSNKQIAMGEQGIDIEKNFNLRPYTYNPWGVFIVQFYNEDGRDIILVPGGAIPVKSFSGLKLWRPPFCRQYPNQKRAKTIGIWLASSYGFRWDGYSNTLKVEAKARINFNELQENFLAQPTRTGVQSPGGALY